MAIAGFKSVSLMGENALNMNDRACDNPTCCMHTVPYKKSEVSGGNLINTGPVKSISIDYNVPEYSNYVTLERAFEPMYRRKMAVEINGVKIVMQLCGNCANFVEVLGGENAE